MPEKKKQHYVPQLLLKNFSTHSNKKLINFFNVDSHLHKTNCPISTQSQEDYFYGKDLEVENIMGSYEDSAAPILTKIIEQNYYPQKYNNDSVILFLFCFYLAYRTKQRAESTNDLVDKVTKDFMKSTPEFKDKDMSDIKIAMENAASYSLGNISTGILKAYDLEMKIINNNTTLDFIISDHPSNLYNQFLEQKKYRGGQTGMYTKGLQLFLPISPKVMIIYYDSWVYKVGQKNEKIISTNNINDVSQLNLLQATNCFELIYTNENLNYSELLLYSKKTENNRKKEYSKTIPVRTLTDPITGEKRQTYTYVSDERNIKLNLSFICQTKQAKKYEIGNDLIHIRQKENHAYH